MIAVLKMLRSEVEAEIGWGDPIIRNYILGIFECEFYGRNLKLDPLHENKDKWFDLLEEFRRELLHTREFKHGPIETLSLNSIEPLMSLATEHPDYFSFNPNDHSTEKAKIYAHDTVELCQEVVNSATGRL